MVGYGAILAVDNALLAVVAGLRDPLLTELFRQVTAAGSLAIAFLLIVGLWLLDERDTAVLSAVGVIVAGSIAQATKLLTARVRPSTVQELVTYQFSTYAFPSGHATVAFVLAAILAARVPQLNWFLYGVATLVAVSRVYLGVHFVSDVLGGAVLGVIVGRFVIRYDDRLLRYAQDVKILKSTE